MYDVIDGDGILDTIFVNGDGVGLSVDDAKWYWAARQGLAICAGRELVCVLIFAYDKRLSLEENIFTNFVN